MTHLSPTTNLRREPNSGAPPTERTNVDRHNSQFIRKLACDFINSNPYRYALTRDGRLVEIQDSKLTAAVQTDLPGSSQTPPDELKTAAQAGHRQRVPRRPSIGKMIAQAEKATGKPVTSITLPDGTKLDFSEADRATNFNPWDRVLPNASKIPS